MPDFYMDVDVALGEVPVNLLPLLDDSDFKTIEDAIAHNAAGMDLRWNFVDTLGNMTSTPVTPTSGGVHDWGNQGDGLYTLEIPASSGTINNDTEGFGWFSGKVTGVLPWRGPTIGFRKANVNNALINGTEFLYVDAMKPVFDISGATLTVKKPDGSTTAYTKTLGTSGSADPIVSSS